MSKTIQQIVKHDFNYKKIFNHDIELDISANRKTDILCQKGLCLFYICLAVFIANNQLSTFLNLLLVAISGFIQYFSLSLLQDGQKYRYVSLILITFNTIYFYTLTQDTSVFFCFLSAF